MAKKPQRTRKRLFSRLQLPVLRGRYQGLRVRPGMWLAGGIALAVLVAVVAVDYTALSGELLSNGPLSNSHAGSDDNCARCHGFDKWGTIPDTKCTGCHGQLGETMNVYSFDAHYVYQSNDLARGGLTEHAGDEVMCAGCHTEHAGREAAITNVPDRRCSGCHFRSFTEDHPVFEFEEKLASNELTDSDALAFTHIRHICEVMIKGEIDQIERACLVCHNPQADGQTFEPIDYELHCDGCHHLSPSKATNALPLQTSKRPGVETLDTIGKSGELDTAWTNFTNPGEFVVSGRVVRKRPVYHHDPWILYNLRKLRREVHEDSVLADLLVASPDVPWRGSDTVGRDQVRALYDEAIATLVSRAIELRAEDSQDAQRALREVLRNLNDLRREIDDPGRPLDLALFAIGREKVTAGDKQAIDSLVAELTSTCAEQCHRVADQTIERVQKDQKVLTRSIFDHGAHVKEMTCLGCHDKIPIAEQIPALLASAGAAAAQGACKQPDVAADRAGTLNVPGRDSCRSCHSPQRSGDRCVTCHYFHPNKSQRANLVITALGGPDARNPGVQDASR